MRLLQCDDAGEICLTKPFFGDDIPQYAILSHTWGNEEEEVSFKDLMDGTGQSNIGYKKIKFCRDQASKDGLNHFWVDTCCIDKSSSAELQEAINCMFRWYRDSTKCYVYLADVSAPDSNSENEPDGMTWEADFQKSRWFTRGWTLQELIAPSCVEFFSQEGTCLGNKTSLEKHIHEVTKIPLDALRGSPLADFSTSERLEWIEDRNTTRGEDKAYSLLGIFDVQIPLLYGEGQKKAFNRLLEEISKSTGARVLSTASLAPNNQNDPATRRTEILKTLHTSPYRDRKDRNPDRVPGTCEWFVSHEMFQTWQMKQSSCLLWVSADPGCGKSVLAKHLVEDILPSTESRTTCYFFFKDDFEDQRSAKSALCCILHQLFRQREQLFTDEILKLFETDREGLIGSFNELWSVLTTISRNESAGEIICILDAFDECDDQGKWDLTQALCKLYGTTNEFNLKFLLLSRPYGDIRRGFQPIDVPGLPVIHLSGESEAEMGKISLEIDLFVQARVQHIQKVLKLEPDDGRLLLESLLNIPHRTYLWVYLTLNLVENSPDIDKSGIRQVALHLPQTIDEAYENILSKSSNSEAAKRLLHIVVAAERPLTLPEMDLALALRENHQSYKELDLKSEARFREYVRDICGLFVTIIGSKIYLLHQTAKEFLVGDESSGKPASPGSQPKWKSSLHLRESHRVITQICIWHLRLGEFRSKPFDESGNLSQYLDQHIFLDYSAKNWTTHARLSEIQDEAVAKSLLPLCDSKSKYCPTWFSIYWQNIHGTFPRNFTPLLIASYSGLSSVVRLLQINDTELNATDVTFQRSALCWASANGYDDVVELLISRSRIQLKDIMRLSFSKSSIINARDKFGRTPLSYAAWNGHIGVVKLLIKAGAKGNSIDEIGGTPISYAILSGQTAAATLLIQSGFTFNVQHGLSDGFLLHAVEKRHEAVVKLLLENEEVDTNARDYLGRTPLFLAASNGDFAMAKLLIESGKVEIDSKANNGQTPLLCAAASSHEAVVRLLLETNRVDVNAIDYDGNTPLSLAVMNANPTITKALLENDKVDANIIDGHGLTPLSRAIRLGDEVISKILLKSNRVKVEISSFDFLFAREQPNTVNRERASLSNHPHACNRVDVNAVDGRGSTPLSVAVRDGNETIVKLLLERHEINVDAKDNDGLTPLSWALRQDNRAIAKLLLER